MAFPLSKTGIAPLFLLLFLGACAAAAGGSREAEAKLARAQAERPVMRWDFRPEGALWTRATLDALASHGAPLARFVPADIDLYCPTYAEATLAERRAFWAGLLSALAKHESTWRPEAVGGGGRWFGLVQIAPATARGYGCRADTGAKLKDGAGNLSCAVRIMARTVLRDGVISAGRRGVAADWGPFSSASKRRDIQSWTRSQPYCGGAAKSA